MSGLLRRLPQLLRGMLQVGVLLFVVWTAFGAMYRNYKAAHNSARIVGLIHGDAWAAAYAANEDLLSAFGDVDEASLMFLGFPWAGRFLGIDTADPILVAAHALKNGGSPIELLLMLALPLLLALVLGKVFCSHLCPMRLLFEVGQRARAGLLRMGIPLPELRTELRLGGFTLVGGLIGSTLSGVGLWLLLLPYASMSAAIFLTVSGAAAGALLGVVGGWFLLDALVAPGFFCHNLCPSGFLLENVGRFSLLRLIKRGDHACPTSCRQCQLACPYGLSPRERSHRPACDNCGRCVPACPSERLVRRLTVLTVLCLAGLGVAAPASAHHNKGLPHYGYFENYPQVPTEEYIAVRDRWEIGATIFNFQGYDRRRADTPNDVKLFLYLYDLVEDRGYRGALDVEIRRDGALISRFERVEVDEEAIYATRETLPESGDYELLAIFPDGETVALDFHVELLEDQINWWLVAGIGLPVLAIFLLAVMGRARRRRRRGPRSRGAAATTAAGLMLAWLAVPALAAAQSEASPTEDMIAAANRCLCGGPPDLACPEYDAAWTVILPARHYATTGGDLIMVMDGIPLWLLLLGVGAIILLSFAATERFAPAGLASPFRFNLTPRGRVYRWLRSRWFQAIPQLAMVAVFAFLIWAGLVGSQIANITPVAVWTLWWAGLVFTVLLFASAWCFTCPWDGLANLFSRLRVAARVEPLSLGLKFPRWAQNAYPAIGLFVLLTWLELGWGVTSSPRSTAYMGLAMAAAAIGAALLWDGKKFCAHMCPVGRICGIYSTMSPLEIRGRKAKTCQACTTEDCLHGNEHGYPCPTGISLKVIENSAMCTMCTECFKSCKKQNIAINLRPFGADLSQAGQGRVPRLDEAWLALCLLSLTLFHGLSMTPAWENFAPGSVSLLKWMALTFGTPQILNFSVAMAVVSALPIALYYLCCRAGAAWVRRIGGVATTRGLFVRYAYSLLPIALFYHLAHNLAHLLSEGQDVVPMLNDPLGSGADLFGWGAATATAHQELVSESTIWYLQVALILVGHVFGVVVAHRMSRGLFPNRRPAATRSLVPMTAMMIAVSVVGLGLMHLDMNMRLGRL